VIRQQSSGQRKGFGSRRAAASEGDEARIEMREIKRAAQRPPALIHFNSSMRRTIAIAICPTLSIKTTFIGILPFQSARAPQALIGHWQASLPVCVQVYGQEHWMSLQRSGSALQVVPAADVACFVGKYEATSRWRALQTISAADVARIVGNHGTLSSHPSESRCLPVSWT
jgi:hypothetical protein